MDRIRKLTLLPRTISELIVDHTTIAEALRAGDGDMAESRMRSHLRTILPSLEHLMEEYPDYFDVEDSEAGVSMPDATGTGQ